VNDQLFQLRVFARRAVRSKDWATVNACAREILKLNKKSAEGWFLSGLVSKASGRTQEAVDAFLKVIQLDSSRYDAAIELAWQYWVSLRLGESLILLERYESQLGKSPLYLDLAAHTFSRLGLHEKAYPLYKKATELQPEISWFQESLAKCSVIVGKIDKAEAIYEMLLRQSPTHQRNHYELSRLERAKDSEHVKQMKSVLEETCLPAEKNIFLYYALAKEFEDLEQWEDAFQYYKLAGDAAANEARKAGYNVRVDVELIDQIIDVCNANWLVDGISKVAPPPPGKTPIFVVGLPRTGTTLTERILSSHSQVESADETQFMQIVIQRAGGVAGGGDMKPAVIESAAKNDIRQIANAYLEVVAYKLGDTPFFIDKLPENFLYLGFIAKAFPDARIIQLKRNTMDTCFAMYKQSFFKFAYTLEDLGRYYVAFDRLRSHWLEVLQERMIEVEYESLVAEPEIQIRALLGRLGLEFEPACLDFHLNQAPSATASMVQVREKIHKRSVNKWKYWARQLQPLRDYLEQAGISTS
jgi:tetratricopeptide (TPR) repeat protein